jgi:vitamin B12/bleomycin/antimicrobial peptide transport system ATP-binding/permease protein
VQYRLNYWNRDFFNALERRDAGRLWEQALIFAPLACLSISLSVASVWGRMTTQRKWREWLTKRLSGLWLTAGRYRRLKFVTGEYQNAEYRICVDARIATDAPVDMAVGLFAAVLTAPRVHPCAVERRRQLDGSIGGASWRYRVISY